MTVLGLVMAAVFVFIRVVPHPRLVAAAARQDWPHAACGAGDDPAAGRLNSPSDC
jgi:hypothetical protein